MKLFLALCCWLLASFSIAQNDKITLNQVSCPEKWWAIKHLFVLKKAKQVTLETRQVVEQLKKEQLLKGNGNGQQLDAFRHTYWMLRLSQEIGAKKARRLGKAHEKGNYKAFKKNKKEDGEIPDKISSDMDLFNNEIGIAIADTLTSTNVKKVVISVVQSGKCKIIKKDQQGNYLTCSGSIIQKEELIGKWKNDKCLVNSNF